MCKKIFRGMLSAREEFFFPDMKGDILPDRLRISMAKNEKPGLQLLMETMEEILSVSVNNEWFGIELFSLYAVPVEYNTGDGKEQGGAMVLEGDRAEKPAYATRKAPFTVYDCLIPISEGKVAAEDGRVAVYICLYPRAGIKPGVYEVDLHVGEYVCTLEIKVFDVEIPTGQFQVTNWFSLEAICRWHNVEPGTKSYYEMVRKYVKLMRRIHQTIFFIQLDERCIVKKNPYQFDFEYLEPLIRIFFDEGMEKMELGVLLSRGFLPDGFPDMYTDTFKCAMAPEIAFESLEGYTITIQFVKALADFLKKNGWLDRVIFHIHDEPDIHYKNEETLAARKRQYFLAANILRKYIPGIQIIEAVSSAQFRGGIDIWVPGTPGYEAGKEEFDRLTELGESVWNYVCCGPEGHWLNRFLDFALLKGRLLFWGCSANRIQGFLHWGWNQFPEKMDPFVGTSCPNDTGIGTNFPCGDSFLVYPGKSGPWPGMRMEAARKGAEDVALLGMLREIDQVTHDQLIARVFKDNEHYNDDPVYFEKVHEEMLYLLEKRGVGR